MFLNMFSDVVVLVVVAVMVLVVVSDVAPMSFDDALPLG